MLSNFEQAADEGTEAVAEVAVQFPPLYLPLLHLLTTSRRVLDLRGDSAGDCLKVSQTGADRSP